MSHKVHIAFPVGMICLILCVCFIFSLTTAAADTEPMDGTAVIYEVSEPEVKESEEVPPSEDGGSSMAHTDSDFKTYTVPEQAHRDSGYTLTEDERIAVECAVMCEAGGEGEMGQMMVAQCILDGTLRNDFDIYETIDYYSIMSTSYSNVTEQVINSVSRVFDNGERVVEEKADLWYNPDIVPSEWHEEQQYVITVGSHRFFWMEDEVLSAE